MDRSHHYLGCSRGKCSSVRDFVSLTNHLEVFSRFAQLDMEYEELSIDSTPRGNKVSGECLSDKCKDSQISKADRQIPMWVAITNAHQARLAQSPHIQATGLSATPRAGIGTGFSGVPSSSSPLFNHIHRTPEDHFLHKPFCGFRSANGVSSL